MRRLDIITLCLILLVLVSVLECCSTKQFSTNTNYDVLDCYNYNGQFSSQSLCCNLRDSSFLYIIQRSLMSPVACGMLTSYNDSVIELIFDEQKTNDYILKMKDENLILFQKFETLKFSRDSNIITVIAKPDTEIDTFSYKYLLFKQ
jgi:hypothetical protein